MVEFPRSGSFGRSPVEVGADPFRSGADALREVGGRVSGGVERLRNALSTLGRARVEPAVVGTISLDNLPVAAARHRSGEAVESARGSVARSALAVRTALVGSAVDHIPLSRRLGAVDSDVVWRNPVDTQLDTMAKHAGMPFPPEVGSWYRQYRHSYWGDGLSDHHCAVEVLKLFPGNLHDDLMKRNPAIFRSDSDLAAEAARPHVGFAELFPDVWAQYVTRKYFDNRNYLRP